MKVTIAVTYQLIQEFDVPDGLGEEALAKECWDREAEMVRPLHRALHVDSLGLLGISWPEGLELEPIDVTVTDENDDEVFSVDL